MKMYSVYDSKTEAYMKPFFTRNRGEAIRSWQEACNDTNSMMYRYPSDFTLFELGEFDDQTGVITVAEVKVSIGVASEFKKQDLTLLKGPEATQ